MTRLTALITVAPLALSLAVASSAIAGTPAPEHDVCSHSSTPLIAGQHHDAGDVVVTQDDNQVCVSFELDNGWYLVETHIAVVTDVADFPRNFNDGPAIGHFPLGTSHSEHETSYTACVTLDELGCGADDGIYIAAHASVERYHNGCVQQETAWGQGPAFGGGSWAMYFSHELASCPDPECAEDEIWDDHAGACVKRCAADQVWNSATASCDDLCPADEIWNGENCECPEGQVRDAETEQCAIVCAAGEELIDGVCKPECAKGETRNAETNECEAIVCAEDETRDAATGLCKPIICLDDEVLVNGMCETRTECADDESYVAESNSCIAKCDGDMLWFEEYGECYEISVTGGGCSATGTSPNGAAALFFVVGALVLWRRRKIA